MVEATRHKTVLLHETINGLNLKENYVVLDCTLGGAGHTLAICEIYGADIRIIGIDADQSAIDRAKERLADAKCKVSFHQANFRSLDRVLAEESVREVNAVIFDLGLSSDQLETSSKGFSFRKDEPLLMTYGDGEIDGLKAEHIVNEWQEENIELILRKYGEERFSFKIASAIVKERKGKPILTTGRLVEVIESAVPKWYRVRKTHYATKTFQALRMAVNDELQALEEGLRKAFEALHPGGRMAVITFHSIEDRIVKHFFKEMKISDKGRPVTKKPITPTLEEVKLNPRSRSAKLRILEKNI
jgi:16S rRNA (cytosine1402-N4)-methyltransferase